MAPFLARFTMSNLRAQQILQALYGFQLLCDPGWSHHERAKLVRKPYFDDALALFEILVLATGEGGDALADWQAAAQHRSVVKALDPACAAAGGGAGGGEAAGKRPCEEFHKRPALGVG